jgi:hypothetical protein
MLTELGKDIVGHTDEAKPGSSLREVLLKPKVFQQAYEKYDRHTTSAPEPPKATFERHFGVPRVDVNACYGVWKQNIDDYNLSIQSGGSTLLYLDNIGTTPVEVISEETASEPKEEQVEENAPQEQIPPQGPVAQEQVVKVPRVFISHGENKKVLNNIKHMLTFGKFEHRVADEKKTLSMPLSDKVFRLMQ